MSGDIRRSIEYVYIVNVQGQEMQLGSDVSYSNLLSRAKNVIGY